MVTDCIVVAVYNVCNEVDLKRRCLAALRVVREHPPFRCEPNRTATTMLTKWRFQIYVACFFQYIQVVLNFLQVESTLFSNLNIGNKCVRADLLERVYDLKYLLLCFSYIHAPFFLPISLVANLRLFTS